MYIEITKPEETFSHVVTAPDGTPSKTVLTLRIVDDAVEKRLRRQATGKPVFERGQRHEPFDSHKFIASVLDYAITNWSGVRHQGQDLPCTLEFKLLLPEWLKTDVIRLCLAKEAGAARGADADDAGDEDEGGDEKKS